MKLAAIYNVWDGVELLEGSIKCIQDHVDVIIIVYQDHSNNNEFMDPWPGINTIITKHTNCVFVPIKYHPKFNHSGTFNETNKRNIGLECAKQLQCSHFFHIDCDEYYENFKDAKRDYVSLEQLFEIEGSVLKMYTYFKYPTLRLANEDSYYVPFIHKLNKDTKAGSCTYPFYCDPTRKINNDNINYLPRHVMHHFSWVRKDIDMKVRNSSARNNIERSQLVRDYNYSGLGPGYYLEDYQQRLIEVENIFNIRI